MTFMSIILFEDIEVGHLILGKTFLIAKVQQE